MNAVVFGNGELDAWRHDAVVTWRMIGFFLRLRPGGDLTLNS